MAVVAAPIVTTGIQQMSHRAFSSSRSASLFKKERTGDSDIQNLSFPI